MRCGWCEEEILDSEECQCGVPSLHHECMTRMAAGSVGHQLGMCHCVGGTMEDPPGMSRRAAALAAMRIAQIRRRPEPVAGIVVAGLILYYFPGALLMQELTSIPDLPGGEDDVVDESVAHIPSIKCPKCGRRSFNPGDVQNRYCGACHEFHDQMTLNPERS